ncbi:MAG: WhiB family transcriptional regulator [Actinoallomurus sp.]
MNRDFHDRLDGRQHCQNAAITTFFPAVGTGGTKHAKALCRTCPLRDPCLQYALAYDLHGIWGGKTRNERKAYQRDRGIKPTPVKIPNRNGTR